MSSCRDTYIRDSKFGIADPQTPQELAHYIERIMQQMQDNVDRVSEKVNNNLDVIGRGVNDLERNIGDLMSQSRIDES